jgi:hypothetical protein
MTPGRRVMALHTAVAAAIFTTHRRVPPARLYNSRRGGASRTVVFANYPTAVAAVSLLPGARRKRLAAAALPLLATAALPGMVDERQLDARRRNAVPLLGVLLAVAAGEGRVSATSFSRPRSHALLGAALLAASTPWVLADLGLQTLGMRAPSPAEPGVDRVHLGHHEGLDGVLLALDGLVLEPYARGRMHRWYVTLMVSYGCAVAARDAWHEQVVKRGWTARHLPDVVRPRPTRAWAVLLAATPLLERLLRSTRNSGV